MSISMQSLFKFRNDPNHSHLQKTNYFFLDNVYKPLGAVVVSPLRFAWDSKIALVPKVALACIFGSLLVPAALAAAQIALVVAVICAFAHALTAAFSCVQDLRESEPSLFAR